MFGSCGSRISSRCLLPWSLKPFENIRDAKQRPLALPVMKRLTDDEAQAKARQRAGEAEGQTVVLLRAIAAKPGASLAEIGKATGTAQKSTVKRRIDRLTEDGLVVAVGGGVGDHRQRTEAHRRRRSAGSIRAGGRGVGTIDGRGVERRGHPPIPIGAPRGGEYNTC